MRIVRSYPLALAGITLAAALSVSAMTANASSTFLMQFGQHDSETAARAQWESLQKNHPELLGDKSLRIAPVTTPSGAETFRTQASGVRNRDEAQNICSSLNSQNVTCLVVETSMYIPDTRSTGTAEADIEVEMAEAFEAATSAAPVQPVLVTGSRLPWLEETSAPAETAQPIEPLVAAAPTTGQAPAPLRPERVEQPAQPAPVNRAAAARMSEELPPGETRVVESRAPRNLNAQHAATTAGIAAAAATAQPQLAPQIEPQGVPGEAQVEVAEAIQVPLSFDETFNDMVAAPPAVANKPVGHAGYPSQPAKQRSLWIQISHFVSKDAAMGYWRELTASEPELMRLLRVRIVTPWSAGYGQRHAALRMGPFTEQADVDNLCNAAAERNLRCAMVAELGGSSATSHARNSASPQQLHDRRAAINRGYSHTAGERANGMFWVQLGAFDTVEAAQQRWQQLKTVHHDVLGRMQPQISYPALSSSPTPVYHLRTGPFVSQTSAVGTCNRLQTRHLGCVVVQTR